VVDWRIDRAYNTGVVEGASKPAGIGRPAEDVIDPETGEKIVIDEDDISTEEAVRRKAIEEYRLKKARV
jgi:hypothetical protein